MSAKNRRKVTLNRKDGESSSQDANMGQNQEYPPTHEKLELKVDQNPTSTPTSEKIVVMYPLENQEPKSVRTIVSSFENIPHEDNNQQLEEAEQVPLDPMTQMLMDIKKSNEANALRISGEIAGLSRTIDENNRELNTKISGIQNTIKVNSEEFKKEILRIDKQLDEGEKKTISLIDKAIAEALRANNASWETGVSKLEKKESSQTTTTIQPTGSSREEAAPRVPSSPTASGSQITWPSIPLAGRSGQERGEKEKPAEKPLDLTEEEKAENARPEKFRYQEHEHVWECREHKRKLIIKVEREDFVR